MQKHQCQIHSLNDVAQPLTALDKLWQFRNRIKRMIKRRWNYLRNSFLQAGGVKDMESQKTSKGSVKHDFKQGDTVRVKSRSEIQATLNKWNQLRGCALMEEMWQYCGTQQKIFKHISKFLDERDYLMKNCKGIVILENVFCEGTKDFGPCDRSCFYFWRTEWLEPV